MELQLNAHLVCSIGAHAKTICQKTQIAGDRKVSESDGNPTADTLPLTTTCHQIHT